MDQNNSDIRTHNAAMRYGYRLGNHSFGFDGDYQDLIPNGVSATRSYRLGLTWTVAFAKPPRVPDAGAAPVAALQAVVLEGPADIYLHAPGTPMSRIDAFLTGAGITGGVTQAGLVVYDTVLLDEIDQRQRLVLIRDDGALATSALIVEFADPTDPAASARAFEAVQESLLNRYGRPSFNFERGEFTANLVDDVGADRFIRITEWATDDGTIRLGIPRRLDGQVRMEIQHARDFPAPGDTRWSIEQVR